MLALDNTQRSAEQALNEKWWTKGVLQLNFRHLENQEEIVQESDVSFKGRKL